jgi:uncharacterized protein (TIGR03437 family)
VTPPSAPNGYRANVVAVNLDGQDSTFLTGDAEPVYVYGGELSFAAPVAEAAVPTVSANPGLLPAGVDAQIEITGTGTNFVDGQTTVGFGSSDITVRRVWVTSPTRLLVNVSVSANATGQNTVLSVTSGLQVISQPFGFQTQTGANRATSISSQFINAATGLSAINPGSPVTTTVLTTTAPLASSSLSLWLNDRQLVIAGVSGNQLSFQIPSDVGVGQYSLRLDSNGQRGLPVGIAIDQPPPQISTVFLATGQLVDSGHPAHPGDLLNVQLTGLADVGAAIANGRVVANVGGIDIAVNQVIASGLTHQVFFFLPLNVATGAQVPVTIAIDGRVSPATLVTIRTN